MAESTGYILAAAGIVLVNDMVFTPIEQHTTPFKNVNWRIVPAVAIAGFTLAGLEKISKPFGVGLAVLGLMAAMIIPLGNAPTPIDNAMKYLQNIRSVS